MLMFGHIMCGLLKEKLLSGAAFAPCGVDVIIISGKKIVSHLPLECTSGSTCDLIFFL